MTDDDRVRTLLEEAQRVGGGIDPDADQLRALLGSGLEGPLQFLNLLEFYDEARYPLGHEFEDQGSTGAEAYNRYGVVALEHVTKRGGRLTLFNQVHQILIGRDGSWHQAAIMEYPSVDAFVDMVSDEAYRASLVHRDAGLARTLVLVTRALLPT